MVHNALINKFENFLDNVFVGTRINRLYFDDDCNNDCNNEKKLIVSKEKIFPVICKKYNIL